MKEIWKQYRSTRYSISNKGGVRNNSTGRILKQTLNVGGYFVVCLYDPIKTTERIHRMVAETFIFQNKDKNNVNHKNGNKRCNLVENLEWVTHSENTLHAYNISLMAKGEDKSWAKLTDKDIVEIKYRFTENESLTEIAKDYKVNEGTISNIFHRRAWKHILPDLQWHIPKRRKSIRKLTADDIPLIRAMCKYGEADTYSATAWRSGFNCSGD